MSDVLCDGCGALLVDDRCAACDPPDADAAVSTVVPEPIVTLTRDECLLVLDAMGWCVELDGTRVRDPFKGRTYQTVSPWQLQRAMRLALKDARSAQVKTEAWGLR